MPAYATIVTPTLPPYRITSDDRLWAARAAQFEGHDAADTLWTWTQRHALPNYRRRYPQLKDLIRAHSQPVNPIWQRTGTKCRPGGQYAGTDHCTEGRLRRRDAAAALPFDAVRPDVQHAVAAWAEGRLPNPVPKSVDFAAPGVAQSFLRRVPGSQLVKQAGNWFISTTESQGWQPGHVSMRPATGAARIMGPLFDARAKAGGGVLVPALVLTGAVAITGSLFYIAWKRRR